MQVPPHIRGFLENAPGWFSQLKAIWLLGSQVNDASKPDSDWDVLVVADGVMMEQIRGNIPLREITERERDRLHLFVSPGSENFVDPWGSHTLNLSEMNWIPDGGIAEYDHNKQMTGESVEQATFRSVAQGPRWKAYRIWPEASRKELCVLDEPHTSPATQPEDLTDLSPDDRRFLGLE